MTEDFDLEKLLKDMSDMKTIIKKQDKRLCELEKKVKDMEGSVEDIVDHEPEQQQEETNDNDEVAADDDDE
ncbi:hypothetical protein ACF0H5_017267 [Mactra antiquata]